MDSLLNYWAIAKDTGERFVFIWDTDPQSLVALAETADSMQADDVGWNASDAKNLMDFADDRPAPVPIRSRQLSRLGWIALLVLTSGFAAWGSLLGVQDAPPADLRQFAPDPDFLDRGEFLIGRPDRTGCPRWTLERVTKAQLLQRGDRSLSRWKVDKDAIRERRATNNDYDHGGYSRGHLVPAADHTGSQDALDSTFTLANCVPQDQALNAGAWLNLERHIRDLARSGNVVWVVTVPLWLPQTHSTTREQVETSKLLVTAIGPNEIWIPTHLAKSLLIQPAEGEMRLETYIAPNLASAARDPIEMWRVSVDDLERKAVCDLWHAIPGETELESAR